MELDNNNTNIQKCVMRTGKKRIIIFYMALTPQKNTNWYKQWKGNL